MGKSSKQTNDPSAFAKPYISGAANAVQGAYEANQPNIQNISSLLQNNMGQVADSTLNNPNLAAANSYNNDVLSGQYLNSNPYLNDLINQTDSSVANKVNASIGTRGGAGGSAQTQLLSRELANNETSLRASQYNTERGNQQQAATTAGNLSNANDNNIQTLMSYLTGQATIPQSGADSYANSIGSLLGKYNTQTNTPSVASSISQGVGTALQLSSLFSDRRLKTDIKKIGEFADGLGRYVWRYVWGGPMHEGVMADEVEALRPWALGPQIAGYATVNYHKLDEAH